MSAEKSFTRREICELTGVEPAHFGSLMRRRELPFRYGGPSDGEQQEEATFAEHGLESEAGRRWGRFSAIEVLALAAAKALTKPGGYLTEGLSWKAATKIISNNGDALYRALHEPEPDSLYCGYVSTPEGADDWGGENVVGTLSQVAKRLYGNGAVSSARTAILVNLSHVLATVRLRAKQAQLSFPGVDFQEAK